ncbi:MAG: hypothetical protein ACLFTR_01405 [Candidatus Woesearchaeota archaeon]
MKANEGEEFRFNDGTSAADTRELLDKVKNMAPEEFAAHVNDSKHDFHQWLSACVDQEAAEKVREAMDQRSMVEKLEGHHWEKEHREKFGY